MLIFLSPQSHTHARTHARTHTRTHARTHAHGKCLVIRRIFHVLTRNFLIITRNFLFLFRFCLTLSGFRTIPINSQYFVMKYFHRLELLSSCVGVLCLVLRLLCDAGWSRWWRGSWFPYFDYLLAVCYCRCSVSIPYGAVGWYAVWDCFFLVILTTFLSISTLY